MIDASIETKTRSHHYFAQHRCENDRVESLLIQSAVHTEKYARNRRSLLRVALSSGISFNQRGLRDSSKTLIVKTMKNDLSIVQIDVFVSSLKKLKIEKTKK